MLRTSLLVTIIVIACSWLNQTTAIGQGFAPSGATEQLVILKNGEVLRGIISRNAEQVFVQTRLGSRLVLPNDQVHFIEATMEGAYWGKLARTKASDIEGQKQLFFWCLKHKLVDQAQNQFDILVESRISATELENLDRQMNVALLQLKNAKIRLAQQSIQIKSKPGISNPVIPDQNGWSAETVNSPLMLAARNPDVDSTNNKVDTDVFRPLPKLGPPTQASNSNDFHPMVAQSSQPNLNSNPNPNSNPNLTAQPTTGADEDSQLVRQVGFEAPLAYSTISIDDRMPSQPTINASGLKPSTQIKDDRDDRVMISIAQLDRETRSMPKGSLGHYRRRVEKVLINKCAKCHDTNSRIMPLMKVGNGQAIPRRLSQRNHHNALKYVNRDSVFQSQLLIAASAPHANLQKPLLKPDGDHLRSLQIWLAMLSNNPSAMYQLPINTPPPALNPSESITTTPAKPIQPVKPERVADDFANSEIQFPNLTKEIPELDPSTPSFKPVDPFDPEIFNRLHRDRR